MNGPPASQDRLLDGRLRLAQPARGHRAGTDALLLAALGHGCAPRHAVDLGAGVGTVGLVLALTCPDARIDLVEREPDLVALAEANIAANGWSERMRALCAGVDTLGRGAASGAGSGPATAGQADLVLANPPFRDAGRGQTSPEAGRATAHAMPDAELAIWAAAAARLLRYGGHFALIHRADAATWLRDALGPRFGGLSLTFVHPREGQPALRVLAVARAGSRAPARILPPLVLHEADGRFTEAAEHIHRLGTWPPVQPGSRRPA